MLLANRTVAESIGKVKKGKKPKTLPYRIHDNPDPQKLETLREFVVKFGYKMKTEGTKGATAKSLNKLMADCDGKPESNLIQMVALRAMMKAKYSVHNIGHFGLVDPEGIQINRMYWAFINKAILRTHFEFSCRNIHHCHSIRFTYLGRANTQSRCRIGHGRRWIGRGWNFCKTGCSAA